MSYSKKHVFPQAPSPTNTIFLRAETLIDEIFSTRVFVLASRDRFSTLELLLAKNCVRDLLFTLIDGSWVAALG